MADMRLDSIGKGQIWASTSDGGHVRVKRIELFNNKPAKLIYEMIPTNLTYPETAMNIADFTARFRFHSAAPVA